MKRTLKLVAGGFLTTVLLTACPELTEIVNTFPIENGGTTGEGPKLTEAEVVEGLKQALEIGSRNSGEKASKVDGFWKNDLIRIPFPPDAQKVKDKLEEKGLFQEKIAKFEETLNRAAEEASNEAAPIFVDAVRGMTVADGFAILKGDSNAATMYLQDKTSAALRAKFQPIVQNAIEKVELTKYWTPVINKYNLITTFSGGEEIDPDLEAYVTQRAMDGLFKLVALEEAKIRRDPLTHVTDILKKVFGSIMGDQ